METITDNIRRYLDGEGEHHGRPVIVVNNDLRVVTGQLYSRLCADDHFAFATGKGLVKRGSDQQWRQLSFKEWETAILDIFTFAKLQEPVGEAPRRLVILDAPPSLFLATCKQTRWCQYSDLFPQVSNGPKQSALIPRP
jgi:hypothetical protein